jgi:hypothetical protein
MAVGFHTVNTINAILNCVFRNTTFTTPGQIYAQTHTSAGDPGPAGTSNLAAEMTGAARQAATWAAPSGGAIALTTTLPAFAITSTEVLGYISLWNNQTVGSGNVYATGQLATTRSVQSGDTFTLNACTISFVPLMA